MLFQELCNSVPFDEVWRELARERDVSEDKYLTYQKAFCEIQSLGNSACQSPITLVVTRAMVRSRPKEWVFDVFGIQEGDENHYALEMTPWEEWANFKVLDQSIAEYGAAAVVAHALNEMTFFGYSAETTAKKVAEEIAIIEERCKKIEEGSEELISSKEVMALLGMTNEYYQEEREEERRDGEDCLIENRRILERLLNR